MDIHRYLQNGEKSESPNTSFCSLFYKLKWNKVKLNALPSVQAVPRVPITVYLVSYFTVLCLQLSHIKWPKNHAEMLGWVPKCLKGET